MNNIIEKYNLLLFQGPLPVVCTQVPSMNELFSKFPFHIHYHPFPAYEKMFPLEKQLPEKLNLYIFSCEQDIWPTRDFLKDLIKNSFYLVGMEGFVYLGNNYKELIFDIGCILSPAYCFEKSRVLCDNDDEEAQIPYCTTGGNTLGIGYSRTAPAVLNKGEKILFGSVF